MNGDTVVKNNKSAIWIAVAVVAIVAAGLYLWFYGNPFAQRNTLTTAVNIENCSTISPQSAVVADGDAVSFINNDGTAHQIDIGGKSIGVPAKSNAVLKASDLRYGAGTYGYACDSKLTESQIVVVPVPGSAAIAQMTFKAMYDGQKSTVQSCLRSALGTEFDNTYGDANYVPSNDSVSKVSNCFASTQPSGGK